MEDQAKKVADAINRARPGRDIEIVKNDPESTIRVYPVKFSHIRKYASAIESAIGKLLKTEVVVDGGKLTSGGKDRLYAALFKIVMEDFIGLIDDTTVPKFSEIDLPHDMIPVVVQGWIEENFLGERLDPWKRVLEDLFKRMTGKDFSISGIFSKSSAPATTATTTSSNDDKKDGLTPGGAILNSGGTLEQPSEQSA